MATTGSDLRQIPNNQEVFLFPHSDTALVLEILEMVEEGGAREDLWEAAKWVNVSQSISFYCSLSNRPLFQHLLSNKSFDSRRADGMVVWTDSTSTRSHMTMPL